MKELNQDLFKKLQAITNEFAVMKSDAEIVKQRARQMLIDKDDELDRMRSGKTETSAKPNPKVPSRMRSDDSQPDSGASTFSENVPSVIEADNTSS